MLDELVADGPAVEVKVLVLRRRPRQLGQADDAAQRTSASRDVQRQALLAKLSGHAAQQALLLVVARQIERHALPLCSSLNATLRVRQRGAEHVLGDVPELRRGALDELPPRRRVEEEVADLDGRADVPRRRLRIGDRAAAVEDLVRRVAVARAAENPRMRHARRCSPAPRRGSPSSDREQIVIAQQLAGRVGCKRQRQFLRRNAAAVVDHADQLPPAVLDLDQ